QNRDVSARAGEAGADLQETARIPRENHVGPGRETVLNLATPELPGRLGLDEVEDPRRATAQRGVRDLQNLELRNGSQQAAGLCADVLRMLQVAGVVIGRPQGQRMALCPRLELRQELRDVPALAGEGHRPLRVPRVI